MSRHEPTQVLLYVYDLTGGMASRFSNVFLGRQVDGIWHTAIVVFSREYFFGSQGISCCEPGGTVLGDPLRVIVLGTTHIPHKVFSDYVQGLGDSLFRGEAYHLVNHNCNNFSNEVSQFLVGQGIPQYILDLPHDVLSTPVGQTFRGLVDRLATSPQRRARSDSPELQQLNSAIEAARLTSIALEERRNALNEKIARRERKKNKKKKREARNNYSISSSELTPDSGSSTGEVSPGSGRRVRRVRMSDSAPEVIPSNGEENGERLPSEAAEEMEAEERREREERKKQRDPPVVFRDAVDVHIEFDLLVGLVDGKLSPEEMQSIEELHQYMLEDEGSWALGDGFLVFVGRLLNDKSLPAEVSVRALNVLSCAALKDDVILVLHQDRRDHVLMNYAHDVDRLPLELQKSLALFMCNLFENLSSSEWLLYISEWQYSTATISNIRVTTKVAVNSLLSEDEELRDRGSAIIHNLACKEKMHQNEKLRRLLPVGSISKVFDDVAVELSMAILQFFNGSPPEPQVFQCMKALARFCQIAGQDVPQLIQMIGPHPNKYNGLSDRVDGQIAMIAKKLR